MSPRSICSMLLVPTFVCAATVAPADTGAARSVTYKIATGTSYTEGCFEPCLCPIWMAFDVRGTFQLTFTGFDGLYWNYAVDKVRWTVLAGNTKWPVTGSGTYRVGGEFASMYQLELDLVVDGRPVEHYDSGLVVGGGAFPRLEALISVNGMYCYDTVFDLRAHPYGDHDGDGDVDNADYAVFADCTGGPGMFPSPQPPSAATAYACLDVFDGDGGMDIDFGDFRFFQDAYAPAAAPVGPKLSYYGNSGCLSEASNDGYPGCGDDTLEVTVNGNALDVVHRHATYNCCPQDIAVSIEVLGDRIRFTETEVLVMPCFCMCCYDIDSTVIDLAPGTYTVEYCWLDWETHQEMCLIEQATVDCVTNADCPEQAYCDKPKAACDGPGSCQPRPDACFTLWMPVCGCDGKTYSNDCDAHSHGVNAAAEGVCPTACYTDADCVPEQYCLTPMAMCSGPGECVNRLPDTVHCLAVWNPVCGCDGQTYSNACYAAKAAVSIDHAGTCIK